MENTPYKYGYITTQLTGYEWFWLGTDRLGTKRPWVRNDRLRKERLIRRTGSVASLERKI